MTEPSWALWQMPQVMLLTGGINSFCLERAVQELRQLLPKANSAFHSSGVGKWILASAGKAKAGIIHSVGGWMHSVPVKLWDTLRMHAIPERLRGVFTTRRYTNPRLPLTSYSGNEKITYKNQVTTDSADKHTAVNRQQQCNGLWSNSRFEDVELCLAAVTGVGLRQSHDDCQLAVCNQKTWWRHVHTECLRFYRVAQKWHHFVYALTLADINRFSQLFQC